MKVTGNQYRFDNSLQNTLFYVPQKKEFKQHEGE